MNGGRSDAPLIDALTRARSAGVLGSIDIAEAIAHSRLYVRGLDGVNGRVVDIGSGGGLPGLVVAWDRPDLALVLVDRRAKRTDLLRRACFALGMEDRVDVVTGDVAGLAPGVDALTARLFGPVGVVAKIAERLVVPGGVVLVSDGPTGHDWSATVAADWARSTLSDPLTPGRVVRLAVP